MSHTPQTDISKCQCCGQEMRPSDYLDRLGADNATLRSALTSTSEGAARLVKLSGSITRKGRQGSLLNVGLTIKFSRADRSRLECRVMHGD